MRYFLFITFVLLTSSFFAQGNGLCANAVPFCSGSLAQYPAGVNTGFAQPGPYYGCFVGLPNGNLPNPAWFTIPIAQSGSISLSISAGTDIDFVCWGPFNSSTGNCNNLTPATIVPSTGGNNGCGSSPSNTETVSIANAQAGEFYVLLISNFYNTVQQVSVVQTNTTAGAGAIGSLSVTATSSICAGQTATAAVLPGAGVSSILWTGPGGFSATNYFQTFTNLTATSVFTITGTAVGNQTCAVTKTITVVPTPTPVILNDGPLCAGANAHFTVTGGTSFSWQGPGNFSSVSSTPAVTNIQLANAGTYSVIASISTCTAAATSTYVVKPNPTVTVVSAGNFCFGQSFNLTASGATTYTFTGPNSFAYQGPNPIFTNNAFNMAGVYNIIGRSNGCSGSTSTVVTINPLPNVNVVSSGGICQGGSLTLTGSGATTYSWAGPNGFSSTQGTVVINGGQPNITGIYTVTGIDANGCVNTGTVNQVVRPNPIVNVYSTDGCMNQSINLSANGGSTYQWEGPGGFTSTSQNPVINNVTQSNSGVYNVTVTSLYGCKKTETVASTVYENPIVQISGATEVCKGQPFVFTASGAVSYKWVNSAGILALSPTFSISSASPELQASYTLVGTDGHFCSNHTAVYPVVNALPAARLGFNKESSCTPFCAEVSLDLLSGNITSYKLKFSDGETAAGAATLFTKCFNTPGVYTLYADLKDQKNCTSVVTKTIEALTTPVADFKFTPEHPNENEKVVTFKDITNNTGIQSWTWNFYDDKSSVYIDTSYKQNPNHAFTETGNYLVFMKVRAFNGCVDSIAKVLVVAEDPTFFVPNSFSPNGDGLNDVFQPKAVGIKKYSMQVFNRWGQLIFNTTDFMTGWNGKIAGDEVAPDGTYIYQFILSGPDREPKTYIGQFWLIK